MSGEPTPPVDNNKENDVVETEKEQSEPAVMAGLTADEIGSTAKSTIDLQDPTRPENFIQNDDAQNLKNDGDASSSEYTHSGSSETQAKLYNDAQSGAGGRTSGTTFDNAKNNELLAAKKERESQRNIAALTVINTIGQFRDALGDFEDKFNQEKEESEETVEKAEALTQVFDNRIKELQDDLANKMATGGALPSEIAATEKLLAIYTETRDGLEKNSQELNDQMKATETRIADLNSQIANMEGDDSATAALKTQLADAQTELSGIQDQRTELAERTATAFKALEITAPLRVQLTSQCGPVTTEKLAVLDALSAALDDGVLHPAELENITQSMKAAKFSPEQAGTFNQNISEAGILVDADGVVLSQVDALAALNAAWLATKAAVFAMTGVVMDVAASFFEENKDVVTAQAAIDKNNKLIEQTESKLKEAEAVVAQEKTETADMKTQSAEIATAAGKYDSVNEYMESKYYAKLDFVAVDVIKGNENGEDIGDVAKDPSRWLKNDSGDQIFIDRKTQELYTIDESSGSQVKAPLSAEETVKYTAEMYSQNKLPGNLIPDTAKNGQQTSSFDPYKDTIFASLDTSEMGLLEKAAVATYTTAMGLDTDMMKTAQGQAVIQKALAEQKEQQLAAEQKLEEVKNSGTDAAGNVEALKQDLANQKAQAAALQVKLDQAKESLKLAQEKEAEAAQAVKAAEETQANNDEKTQDAETSENKTSTADESDIKAPVLEMDADIASYGGKVKDQMENGTITRDNLNEALTGASPAVRASIENALKDEGIEIDEPENKVVANNTSNFVNADNTLQFTVIPGVTATGEPIQAGYSSGPTNGVSPATEYKSFADGEQFAATHDAGDATYKIPANDGTKNIAYEPSSIFGKGPNFADAASGSSDLTPEQILELRAIELEQANTLNGGMGTMT